MIRCALVLALLLVIISAVRRFVLASGERMSDVDRDIDSDNTDADDTEPTRTEHVVRHGFFADDVG